MKKDPVQLQQRVIYYKAELDKYKRKVQDYQENYHYALLEKLKNENEGLLKEKAEWETQNRVEKAELSKRTNSLEKQISLYKDQIIQLNDQVYAQKSACERLRTEKTSLFQANKGLENDKQVNLERVKQYQRKSALLQESYLEVMRKFKAESRMKQEAAKRTEEYLDALRVEKEERKTEQRGYEQEVKHLQIQVKEMKEQEKEWLQSIKSLKEEQEILKEEARAMEVSLDSIRKENESLKQENAGLLEQIESKTKSNIENNPLPLLEEKMQQLLGESINFHEAIDTKTTLIETLESKLKQLSEEIDDLEQEEEEEN